MATDELIEAVLPTHGVILLCGAPKDNGEQDNSKPNAKDPTSQSYAALTLALAVARQRAFWADRKIGPVRNPGEPRIGYANLHSELSQYTHPRSAKLEHCFSHALTHTATPDDVRDALCGDVDLFVFDACGLSTDELPPVKRLKELRDGLDCALIVVSERGAINLADLNCEVVTMTAAPLAKVVPGFPGVARAPILLNEVHIADVWVKPSKPDTWVKRGKIKAISHGNVVAAHAFATEPEAS